MILLLQNATLRTTLEVCLSVCLSEAISFFAIYSKYLQATNIRSQFH